MEILRSPPDRTVRPVQYSDESESPYKKCIPCLRDKGDQLPKMRGLFLGMDLKYLTRRVVMVPLLQKFFFIRERVSLDQILKLREVRRAQESPYHDSHFFQGVTKTRAGLPYSIREPTHQTRRDSAERTGVIFVFCTYIIE